MLTDESRRARDDKDFIESFEPVRTDTSYRFSEVSRTAKDSIFFVSDGSQTGTVVGQISSFVEIDSVRTTVLHTVGRVTRSENSKRVANRWTTMLVSGGLAVGSGLYGFKHDMGGGDSDAVLGGRIVSVVAAGVFAYDLGSIIASMFREKSRDTSFDEEGDKYQWRTVQPQKPPTTVTLVNEEDSYREWAVGDDGRFQFPRSFVIRDAWKSHHSFRRGWTLFSFTTSHGDSASLGRSCEKLADSLLRVRQYSGARKYFRHARDLGYDSLSLRIAESHKWEAAGKIDTALEVIGEALEGNPTDSKLGARLAMLVSRIYTSNHMFDSAIACLKYAILQSPADASLSDELRRVEVASTDYARDQQAEERERRAEEARQAKEEKERDRQRATWQVRGRQLMSNMTGTYRPVAPPMLSLASTTVTIGVGGVYVSDPSRTMGSHYFDKYRVADMSSDGEEIRIECLNDRLDPNVRQGGIAREMTLRQMERGGMSIILRRISSSQVSIIWAWSSWTGRLFQRTSR